MKKILIFYGSYGGGHIAAARNIKEYFENSYDDYEISMIDCVEYTNKIINKITTKAYADLSKYAHWLWKKIYFSSENGWLASFSNFFNKLMANKLNKLIQKFSPDIIISTHPFSSQMCAVLKKKGKLNCLLATVMTDYVEHNQWFILHEFINFYFVAHDEMKDSLIKKGVDANKIYVTGIPFSNRFLESYNKKEILSSYDLREDKSIALFFAGGAFGFGKKQVCNMLKSIIHHFPDLQVIAISGKNPKIKKSFDTIVKETRTDDYVKILSFTDKVPELMHISDFVITKPGGLTTTESLVSGLPMVIINPIPGQEEENANFVVKNGAGVLMKKGDHLDKILDELLSSKDKLSTMAKNAKSISKKNATRDICETLLSAMCEKNTL